MSTKTNDSAYWQRFALQHALTPGQLEQFQAYYNLLIETNKIHNLTTITKLKNVLNRHFTDSLMLGDCMDLHAIRAIADVGAGGGFPGIPLKIKYPHLSVTLIEVTFKKQEFLRTVIETLGLADCTVSGLDWLTYIRSTNNSIDLFCARASLQPSDLLRALRPSSPYKNAHIVYWASKEWTPDDKVAPYVLRECGYKVDRRERKLVYLGNT